MILTHHTPDGVRRSRHQSLELYGLPAAAGSPAVTEALDEIVRVARSFSGADGATINLLPDGRQVTIAATAAESPGEIPEAHSVCATLLEQRPVSTIVVHDLSRDHRFADNPYVVGADGLRGFSSTPLVGRERVAIGTLCLWSLTPRGLTRDQMSLLDQLARAAVKVLDDARHERRGVRRFPEHRVVTPLPTAS